MLRVISQAAGAVMWEVAPGSDPDAKKGRQFVLGSWFEDPNVRIWYYLTLEDSLTGETIRAGIPRFSPVVADEPSTPERAKQAMLSGGFTTLVPDLYAALVDRSGLNLLQNLNQTLRKKAYSPKRAVMAERQKAVQDALNEVVRLISGVFNCRETCIFLENRFKTAGVFEPLEG